MSQTGPQKVALITPDEIYNLAAMSHVAVSFETPEYTPNAHGIGTLRILEAIRQFSVADTARAISCRDSQIRRAGFAADDYNQ